MAEIIVPPFIRARHTDNAFRGEQAVTHAAILYRYWSGFTSDFAEGVGALSYAFRDQTDPYVVSKYLEGRLISLELLDGACTGKDSVTQMGWVAINMFRPVTYEMCDDIDVEISEPFVGIEVMPVLANCASLSITVQND